MFRSLHMKLVLIMVLLIVALMTVVGAFLMNSVTAFYLDDFYSKMSTVLTDEQFVRDVTTTEPGETDAPEKIQAILRSYVGPLGVDSRTRNYYILDGETAQCLATSDDAAPAQLSVTPNLSTALLGEEGYSSDPTADYMDVAVPITRGDGRYILYILDSRQTSQRLSDQLFTLILEALVFGLAISVLLSFLLSKTMITPIERLTDGVLRVAEGDFSHKIEVASRDEIGVLTDTFNDMAGQLQDTLRQVENERNKLDTLFLHMTDGVVAFSHRGKVIHANPAAGELLRRTIDADTDYDALFADVAPFYDILSTDGQPGYLTAAWEGEGKYLELTLAPFDKESPDSGVLVVLHNVTEQRRNEEVRREFVANVSHELRTPLTNIRTYAETLADSDGTLPEKTRQSFFGIILSETDRMTHIVQDLLTLSRFDSGRGEMNFAPFSFLEATEHVCKAVRLEAERHRHTLTLQSPRRLPNVVGDRERIVQVMMNIVSNSIKYTPDGGHIAMTVGKGDRSVWLEVDDDGIGIPEPDRERIFERFYRVDKARSRQSGHRPGPVHRQGDRGPAPRRPDPGGQGGPRPAGAAGAAPGRAGGMRGKRRRLWEGGKTLLILLLSCSALYLASRVLSPGQADLSPHSGQGDGGGGSTAYSAQTLRPAAFAVTWEEGRYGLLYHQEDQEGYTQLSALLAEALSGAGAPEPVSRGAWLRALAAPGVFFEYLGPIPLDSLTRWLSGLDNAALTGSQAVQLCVAGDALFFRDGEDRLWSCPLSGDLSQPMAELFRLFSPNGARFAGEDAGYRLLRPDSLVLPVTPDPPQLAPEDPIGPLSSGVPGETLSRLLQALSFHPQTNPLYDVTGGWGIADSGEALRIADDGQITYRRSDDSQARYPAPDPLDATRLLAERTVGAVGGDGRLFLREVRQEGQATVVSYGYAYRGAAILVDGEDWCARFTVENGAVSAFTLKPRRYTVLGGSATPLLPQEQAAAALPGGEDQTLELLYDDNGAAQALLPFWAVRDREE